MFISNSLKIKKIDFIGNFQNYEKNYAISFFIVEKLFQPELILYAKPTIIMEECNFSGFNENGFSSVFRITEEMGILKIKNISVIDSCLNQGFIYYSNQIILINNNLINFVPQSFELEILKIRFINYQTKTSFGGETFIFNFERNNINVLFLLTEAAFNQIDMAIIFFFNALNEQSKILFEYLYFQNLTNSVILKSQDCKANFFIYSMNVNLAILAKPLMIFHSNCDLLIENSSFSDLKSMTNADIFYFLESNFTLNSSNFLNIICYSLFSQISAFFAIFNSTFDRINFQRSLLYSFQAPRTQFESSLFLNISSKISIFYYSGSTTLLINNSFFLNCRLFSFFYIDKSVSNIITNSCFQLNVITIFWKEDQTCETTLLSNTSIIQNLFSSMFYKNIAIPQSSIYFQNIFFQNNNFTSLCLIMMMTGYGFFQKFFAIQNFFLNANAYQNAFALQVSVKIIFKNSLLEDCGVISRKNTYQAAIKNAMVYIWYIIYASFENVTFIATKNIELASGFISSGPAGDFLEIIGSNFIFISVNENFEYKGLLLDSPKKLILQNNKFQNLRCNKMSFAHLHGAVFLSGSSSYKFSENSYNATILNNKFINCPCFYGGGLAITSILNVKIFNCTFVGNSAMYKGGSLLLISNPFIEIKNLLINESEGDEGGSIYLENSKNVIISNIILSSIYTIKSGVLYIKNIEQFEISNLNANNIASKLNGGLCYIFKSAASFSNIFLNYSEAREGGAFYIDGMSTISIINLNLNNCFALQGGAISLINIDQILLTKIFLSNVSSEKFAGVFLLENLNCFNITEFYIQDCFTQGTGLIYIKTTDENSKLHLFNGTLKNTFAKSGSCLFFSSSAYIIIRNFYVENAGNVPFYFMSSFLVSPILKNITITKCNVKSSLILFIGFNCDMQQVKMENNIIGGTLIFFQNGVLNLQNSSFINNSNIVTFYSIYIQFSVFNIEFIIVKNMEENTLGFLDFHFSIGNIKNGLLSGLKDQQNSIFLLECGDLIISQIIFKSLGSLIINMKQSNLQMEEVFISNSANQDYTFINFVNDHPTIYNISLTKTFILSSNLITIFLSGPLHINIQQSSFKFENPLKNDSLFEGTGIFLININFLNISTTKFEDFPNRAFIIKNENVKQPFILLANNTFYRNRALFGGAVFLSFIFNVTFYSCFFIENEAYIIAGKEGVEGIGGCIFVKGYPEENWVLKLFSNVFKNNIASKYVHSIFSQTQLFLENNTFFNCLSTGMEIISFPLKLKLLNLEKIDLVSGKELNLTFSLYDYFESLIFFDQSSVFNIGIPKETRNHNVKLESTISIIQNGTINFPKLKIFIQSNTSITLLIDGFFQAIKSNYIASNNIMSFFTFKIRECLIGEIILNDLTCFKCPEGYYSLSNPSTKDGVNKCQICPQDAECPGGYFINPRPGFFKFDFFSESVVQCLTFGSCLGLIGRNYNERNFTALNGGCLKGNLENLCYYCEEGYGRSSKNEICEDCKTVWLIVYFKFIGYVLFIIFYIILNCYLAEKMNENNFSEEMKLETLNKFIVNHTQQISIIILSSKFPNADFQIVFELADYLSFSNPFALTNDCMVQFIYYEKQFFIILKEIVTMILPIIFASASFFIWFALYFCMSKLKKFHFLKEKLPKTCKQYMQKISFFLVLSAFMFYALILKSCFLLFDCQHFKVEDNTPYLKLSPNIICWQSIHIKYVLFGLPGLIIWGLVFPILLAKILKENDRLMTVSQSFQFDESKKKASLIKSSLILPFNINSKDKILGESNVKEKTPICSATLEESNKFVDGNVGIKKNLLLVREEEEEKKELKRRNSHYRNLRLAEESKHFLFFYQDFKHKYYYWESLIFFRKFIITFFYTLNEGFSEEIKQYFMIFFVGSCILITKSKKPFKNNLCNNLEKLSLYAIGISALINYFSKCNLSSGYKFLLLAICLFINAIFFLIVFVCIAKIGIQRAERMKEKIKKKVHYLRNYLHNHPARQIH